ncbi:MAG: hypothetical protein HY399_06310, partial [Elusimicrobia bacterium]|nr:hypothetical protein [Elusimicrobiota bacterium]
MVYSQPSDSLESFRSQALQKFEAQRSSPDISKPRHNSQPASHTFGPPNKYYALGSLGQPLFKHSLDPLLNKHWRSGAKFDIGGNTVIISADRSINLKNSWFIGFYVEGAARPDYYNASQVNVRAVKFELLGLETPNLPIPTGGLRSIPLEGTDCTVYFQGNWSDRAESIFNLEYGPKKDRRRRKFVVREVAQKVYESGINVQMGATQFSMLYLNNITENADGEFEAL